LALLTGAGPGTGFLFGDCHTCTLLSYCQVRIQSWVGEISTTMDKAKVHNAEIQIQLQSDNNNGQLSQYTFPQFSI
jgi:hypothetical protein